MSEFLDLFLVISAVAIAAAYLVWRKIDRLRRISRDWSTGHSEAACDSCPVMKARRLK